ncbi:MAG: cell-cell cohesion protein MtsD [Myxococcaceae bacterium]
MNLRTSKSWGTASGLLAVLLFVSCTDAAIEPTARSLSNLDDRLSLEGRVCTRPPDPNGFPVKVLFVIDISGSMCISDPPGSQGLNNICELVAANEGVPVPGRVRALRDLLTQFSSQSNVSVSIVPFESNVGSTWPVVGFGPAGSVPAQLVSDLQNRLGRGTDYQGALSEAYARIATDVVSLRQSNPALLQRTRYVVVFLTDGTPYPRCTANDPPQLGLYASPYDPQWTWADSSSAGDFCNRGATVANGGVAGFVPGSDLNQNYQIFSKVDQIMDLKDQYNVGDIRFHSVLLFNELAVQRCGTICQDIYGVYPGIPQAQYPAAAKNIATWTLQNMADRGNGVYQEFVNSQVSQLSLGALDYTSLASRSVLKTLMAQALSSGPGVSNRVLDTDGDTLPDTVDNPLDQGAWGTSRFDDDSDDDCFEDAVEVMRRREGFIAANDPDPRGRPPNALPGCPDTEGDGMSTYAEAYFGTHNALADTDADGVPDGMEVRFGLDPVVSNAGLDTDGDGLADPSEFLAGSDPLRSDRSFYDRRGFQYETQAQVQGDGSVCYDYTVSNLQLVTPPARAGASQGYNLFKLFFSEAAESGVATDYGIWKAGCAWAQYDPPGVRDPLGAALTLNNNRFFPLNTFLSPDDYTGARCVGVAPAAGTR